METARIELRMRNRSGLHARPSAFLSQFMHSFPRHTFILTSEIDGAMEQVDGTSVLGLLLLAAEYQRPLMLSVTGPAATEIATAIRECVEFYLPILDVCDDVRSFAADVGLEDESIPREIVSSNSGDLQYWLSFATLDNVVTRIVAAASAGNAARTPKPADDGVTITEANDPELILEVFRHRLRNALSALVST